MEFWSALFGAVVGGAASFAAAVWTIRRTATQTESDWQRDKRADALVEFDLMINLAFDVYMAPGVNLPRMSELLLSPDWTRAQRTVNLWVPGVTPQVESVTAAFWAYANSGAVDDDGVALAHIAFMEGMQRELGLPLGKAPLNSTPAATAPPSGPQRARRP